MNSETAAIASRALLVFHGSVTVVFQDGRIVSMEVMEKSRFIDGKPEGFAPATSAEETGKLAKKLSTLFRGVMYGKIVLFIKNGKVVQYSRQEQYRLSDGAEGL